MHAKVLCIALFLFAAACAPVEPIGPDGLFDAGQDELKISRDERDPTYNVVSYTVRDDAHATIEKTFVMRSTERGTYELFGHTFESFQCLEDKGRADFSLFLVSGARVQKLEKSRPFTLNTNDVVKVSIDNGAGCKSIFFKFAAVKE